MANQFADTHVGDSVQQALIAGMSESTTESQHIKAIAVLTAKQSAGAGDPTALTTALAVLTASLNHLRDPKNK